MRHRLSDITLTPIVDPAKLDQLRGLIDHDIVERHIEKNLDFRFACVDVMDSIDSKLYFTKGLADLYLAWIDAKGRDARYPDEHAVMMMPDGSSHPMPQMRHPRLFTSNSWILASQTRVIACTEKDSILAACLLAVQNDADVFYTEADAYRFLPASTVQIAATMDSLILEPARSPYQLQPIRKSNGGISGVEHLNTHVTLHTLDVVREWVDAAKKHLDELNAKNWSLFAKHGEAMRSGIINQDDLPSALSSDEQKRLELLARLILPYRDHSFAMRALVSAVCSASTPSTEESPSDA